MFCQNCGTQLDGNEKFCQNCGANLTQNAEQKKPDNVEVVNNTTNDTQVKQTSNQNTYPVTSKKGLGILLGLFLGLLGLVIGLLMFNNEYERKTFINGWLISLAISAGLIVLYFVAVFGIIGAIAY